MKNPLRLFHCFQIQKKLPAPSAYKDLKTPITHVEHGKIRFSMSLDLGKWKEKDNIYLGGKDTLGK